MLFTFYIQDVLKLKKNNSGAKSLICLIYYCKSHEYFKSHVTDKFNKINMTVRSDKSKTADVNFIEFPLEFSVALNLLAT